MTVTHVTGPARAAGPVRRLRGRADGHEWWRDGALVAFIALAVIAAGWYLWIGRHNWFWFDEWDFLAHRTAGSLNDLLTPHTDEHWSTVPILIYRLVFNIFGLRSYLPYMSLSIGLHVVVAALLRAVMRNAGVHPWWATIAAGAYLFFGTFAYDTIWAFQINFELALAFGLTQLLLAGHDGPIGRRDLLALGAGLLGLMSSAPAVVMVIAVGIATLLRRGWRPALLQTAPLGVIYVVWRNRYARSHMHLSASDVWRFVRVGMRSTFQAMGGGTVAALLLVAVLAVGWALVLVADRHVARGRLAAPIGLLCCAPLSFAITSLGRSAGALDSGPAAARYLDIGAVLALPAIAVACDALTRRWRVAAPVALLLVVGLHANLDASSTFARQERTGSRGDRIMISTITKDPLAREVSPNLRPDASGAPEITIGWLLAAERAGRLPPPWQETASVDTTNHLRLALDERRGRIADNFCALLRFGVDLHLRRGDRFQVHEGAVSVSEPGPNQLLYPLVFGNTFRSPGHDFVITATTGPLVLRVQPFRVGYHFPTLCLPRRRPSP